MAINNTKMATFTDKKTLDLINLCINDNPELYKESKWWFANVITDYKTFFNVDYKKAVAAIGRGMKETITPASKVTAATKSDWDIFNRAFNAKLTWVQTADSLLKKLGKPISISNYSDIYYRKLACPLPFKVNLVPVKGNIWPDEPVAAVAAVAAPIPQEPTPIKTSSGGTIDPYKDPANFVNSVYGKIYVGPPEANPIKVLSNPIPQPTNPSAPSVAAVTAIKNATQAIANPGKPTSPVEQAIAQYGITTLSTVYNIIPSINQGRLQRKLTAQEKEVIRLIESPAVYNAAINQDTMLGTGRNTLLDEAKAKASSAQQPRITYLNTIFQKITAKSWVGGVIAQGDIDDARLLLGKQVADAMSRYNSDLAMKNKLLSLGIQTAI